MNAESLKLCENLVPGTYVQQGAQAKHALENKIRIFLQHVCTLPGTSRILFFNNIVNKFVISK